MIAGPAGWAVGAVVIAAAAFVMGMTGFGVGLVSLAFLPYVMSPAQAIVLVTLYAGVFAAAIFVPVRRDFAPRRVALLMLGTLAGTPFGVLTLATIPAGALTRLIGLMLLVAVALEWRGLYPRRLEGAGWALGAGGLAGLIGGAVGTPGPPVVLYMTAQRWSPRAVTANLQAFFVVNQLVILIGYAWAGLLTPDVWRLAALYALPALAGLAAGMRLFRRIDPLVFRRVVFALLFVSGLALLTYG